MYPYGATINTVKPSIPILSTGTVSFPLNRPVLSFTYLPQVENNPGNSLTNKNSWKILINFNKLLKASL